MMCLPRPVTKMNCSMPASRASSTPYWITGLSTTGSISFGTAFVEGRKGAPIPATGKTALRIGGVDIEGPMSHERKAGLEGCVPRAGTGFVRALHGGQGRVYFRRMGFAAE